MKVMKGYDLIPAHLDENGAVVTNERSYTPTDLEREGLHVAVEGDDDDSEAFALLAAGFERSTVVGVYLPIFLPLDLMAWAIRENASRAELGARVNRFVVKMIRAMKERRGVSGLVTNLSPAENDPRDWRMVDDDVTCALAKQS